MEDTEIIAAKPRNGKKRKKGMVQNTATFETVCRDATEMEVNLSLKEHVSNKRDVSKTNDSIKKVRFSNPIVTESSSITETGSCTLDPSVDLTNEFCSIYTVANKKISAKKRIEFISITKASDALVSDKQDLNPDINSDLIDELDHVSNCNKTIKEEKLSPTKEDAPASAVVSDSQDSNSAHKSYLDPSDVVCRSPKKRKKNKLFNSNLELDDFYCNADVDNSLVVTEQESINHAYGSKQPTNWKQGKSRHSTSVLDDVVGNTPADNSLAVPEQASENHSDSSTQPSRSKKRKRKHRSCMLNDVDSSLTVPQQDSENLSDPLPIQEKQQLFREKYDDNRPLSEHKDRDHDLSNGVEVGSVAHAQTPTRRKSKQVPAKKKSPVTCIVAQGLSNRELCEEILEIAHENEEKINSVIDESNNALSRLIIVVPYAEHPSRKLETTLLKPVPAQIKEKIASMGMEMKTGKFNAEEDKTITENWNDFVVNYGISNPQYFTRFKNNNNHFKSALNIDQRRNFVRYLARGLEHRYLQSIYARFRCLFKRNTECGKFSAEEDKLILSHLSQNRKNPYYTIALVLQRDRHSVYRRCKLLQTMADLGNPKDVFWNLEMKAKLVESLLQATKREDVKGLRDLHLTSHVWTAVEKIMGVRSRKLEHIWHQRLYTQLFAKKPLFINKICIKVLDLLHSSGAIYWQDVKWNEVAQNFRGVDGLFLWNRFYSTVKMYVPKKKWVNLHKCVQHLRKHWLPNIVDIVDKEYPRLCFKDGVLTRLDQKGAITKQAEK